MGVVKNQILGYYEEEEEISDVIHPCWELEGFNREEAEQWMNAGFKHDEAEEASQWGNYDFTPFTARLWIEAGLGSGEANLASQLEEIEDVLLEEIKDIFPNQFASNLKKKKRYSRVNRFLLSSPK